jgi:protein-S-isoprenylcysteine O-methyltransferase Ste14
LVALQFSAIGLCVFPFAEQKFSLHALILGVAGIFAGIWTLWHNRPGNFSVYPEPIDGCRLITSGPYRFIRHPMYSSLLLMMAGIVLYNAHWLNALGFVLVLFAVLGKISAEEHYLGNAFTEYPGYRARTKRLVPFVY